MATSEIKNYQVNVTNALKNSGVTQTATYSGSNLPWLIGHYVYGWGIAILIQSGKTLNVTKAEIFNDAGSWVTCNVSSNYQSTNIQRIIVLNPPASNVTIGRSYLCRITGSLT